MSDDATDDRRSRDDRAVDEADDHDEGHGDHADAAHEADVRGDASEEDGTEATDDGDAETTASTGGGDDRVPDERAAGDRSTEVDRPAADPDVDPFSDLAEPDGDVEELFTEVQADDVDAESVWAELDGFGSADADAGADGDDYFEEPTDAVVAEASGDEAVVSKATYCQRCEHFSRPPDVRCNNPGTEIVELVDVKHLRVRDCPVVAQRRGATVSRLERDDGSGSDGRDVDLDGERDTGQVREPDQDGERGDQDGDRGDREAGSDRADR